MKTIALVGGIGSGKSTIARMFAELGAGVVNLDDVGHFVLTTPGVKHDIARTFGASVFDEKGEVVRSRLAAAAFDTPEHTEWLNAITHPAIMKECRRRIAELGQLHDVVVVEVTTGVADRREVRWADALVAVTAPACVRMDRACARGEQSVADVGRRIALQRTDAQLSALADYTIDNGGDLEAAKAKVGRVYDALVHSAAAPKNA